MCRIPLTLCAVYSAFAFHNLPSEMTFFRALKHKRRTKEKWSSKKKCRRCHRYSRLIYRLPSTFHNSHKTIYIHTREVNSSVPFYTFDRCFSRVSRIVVLHSYIYARFASSSTVSFSCPQTCIKRLISIMVSFLLFAHFICATLFVCTQIKVGPLKGFMHIVLCACACVSSSGKCENRIMYYFAE